MAQQTPGSEPHRLRTCAICIVSGALAGVLVAACSIFVEICLSLRASHLPIATSLHIVPLWTQFNDSMDARFLGGVIFGALGGFFTVYFSRATRRPHVLASIWASILGTAGLVIETMIQILDMHIVQPAEFVAIVGIYLALGAVFGFALGLFSHWIETLVRRLRPPIPCK